MYDRKTRIAVTASGMLAVIAVLAALWRLIMGLRAVGIL